MRVKIGRVRRSMIDNSPKRNDFHACKLSFRPVYVDELFNQPEIMGVDECHVKEKVVEKSSVLNYQAETSSSSGFVVRDVNFNEVDLKAEMFIAKFKEEMRLQRQRSFGEYQEMLARGV